MAALAEAMLQAQAAEQKLRTTAGATESRLSALEAQIRTASDQLQQLTAGMAARVEALETLVARAKSLVDQTEEFNRRANSESGYAFNAKVNAEEHAKVISQVRGAAEVDLAAVAASKTAAENHAQVVAQVRANADAVMQVVSSLKEKASRDSELINSSAERVQASMPAIEKGVVDANAISASKANAEAATAAIQTVQGQATEAAAKVAADAAQVAKAEKTSTSLVVGMTEAKERADGMNVKLGEYEQGILDKMARFKELEAKIEGLVPGATSAGLAAAFRDQKERFKKPQLAWVGVFVVAVVALLFAAVVGLPASNESWDAILRHLVNRLPLVGPLIWLAIYSGHHYNMALRMQEEYAFKEAVSRAFEGYKREMEGIDASSEDQARPLVTLCENVLTALAERPGRIYEGGTDVATPMSPLLATLKDLVTELGKRSNDAASAKAPADGAR
ncbi:hypothetical protein [Roseateles sp.]|uniref:hypothetical protein n=1 Tax=Roseateles sp. TaxID=1971397 RepID=UPI0025EE6776|nr:hypothetical protein [Roseateles sp.]MBV8036309.1 hypothetical protein [Roseateles sp.]